MLIQADMHTHTVASTHAYSTVRENAELAQQYGLKAFAVTDHAPAMSDAPHIWHFDNLRCLPRRIHNVLVLRGVEANIIDTKGNIDIGSYQIKMLDWIIASLHGPSLPEYTCEDYSSTYMSLAKNRPEVDVIGHCTTDAYPFAFEPVLKCFKEYGKLVEINEANINNKPDSKRNAYEVMKICKRYEIPIIINTDAHYCELIGQTNTVEKMVSELDFPRNLIFNSDIDRVLEYLSKKKGIDYKKF